MPEMTQTMKTFADAEAVLAQRLPGYESRPQQQTLAAAVENLLAAEEPRTGLFEAGCGTGKSLGLMIPAILSGRKTLVATGTKALMEQYANSDIPFLVENLGVDFTWAMVKGRSNYFCFAKAENADKIKHSWIPAVAAEAINPDHDGDAEHFATDFPADEWYAVSTSSADCPGASQCPFGKICKAQMAKAKAREADLILTNTMMLMTDLVIRDQTDGDVAMLGDYEVVVIDEAHEVEEWATGALSAEIKRSGIEALLAKAASFSDDQRGNAHPAIDSVSSALALAWSALDSEMSQSRFGDPVRLPLAWFLNNEDMWADLIITLRDLSAAINQITVRYGDEKKETARKQGLAQQALNAANKVEAAMLDADADTVRWIEKGSYKRGRDVVTYTALRTAPVHVGSFLDRSLWSRVPAVLASATLSSGGDFTYVAGRLGIESPETINVGTPFDYSTQARLFIPDSSVPNPQDKAGWMTYTTRTTIALIDAAGGGALLLFTSRKAMQEAYNTLADEIAQRGHTVLMQGKDGTNKEIAARFQSDTTSVLFALRSFFTGVDFRGDTCRLVVIDKMPFPVPSEPVFAARSEAIERAGGSGFSNLSVPAMTLTLVQGFGRLIRSKTDKGIVAILDSRLSSKGYGRKIVKALPDSPVISTLAEAEAFFAA